MTKTEILKLEKTLESRPDSLHLLTAKNAQIFIQELHNANIDFYAFEGFIIHLDSIVQPEQDFSRDYTRFTSNQAYELCLEYFAKDKQTNVMYEIAYDRIVSGELYK